ncbi:MAG TPA: hypothetical protein VHB70_19730 [Parafilimonas sp.]|nr:hypothetical protein [Parafilimonas sp.]
MKQLQEMVEELEKHLQTKKQNLHSLNAYKLGQIRNIEIKLLAFSETIRKVSDDPTLKNQIISNFKETKKEIINEIDSL